MKAGIIIVSLGLLAGCARNPNAPTEQAQIDPPISREQAVEVASEANVTDYDRADKIRVELTNGQYIVTFPVKKPALQRGTRWRGPDYAAKIWVDARTGKVLKHMVGS